MFLSRCRFKASGGTSPPPLNATRTLDLLDEISATLCEVIDTAEAVRNVHPRAEYRAAADEVFAVLSVRFGPRLACSKPPILNHFLVETSNSVCVWYHIRVIETILSVFANICNLCYFWYRV